MSETMDAALAYAARGWYVVPVHRVIGDSRCSCKRPACASPGKHPRIAKWRVRATTDRAQVLMWWRKWPSTNIGIATGAASGIVVVDVDPRHGGNDTLAKLDVPETYTVATGGDGRHFYFRHPGVEIRNSTGKIGPGIDVRGDGGFVVAPPSNHVSGAPYTALADRDLAPLPAWALADTRSSGPEMGATTAGRALVVAEGSRNNRLMAEAGRLRNLGLEGSELLKELLLINAARCDPPLRDDEVAGIARSVSKYERSFNLTDLGNAERLADQHGQILRYSATTKAFHIWDGMRWRVDDIGRIAQLAAETVRAMYADALQATDLKVWEALIKHALKAEDAYHFAAMQKLVQALEGIAMRAQDFDVDPMLLNVLNGTVELETGRLRPHRQADLMTRLAPVTYEPGARSPTLQQYLDVVTGGDAELQRFLQLTAGYALTGLTREEKMFFIFGPGASGKSTFIDMLKSMLGDYAMTADFETFLKRSGGGGIRNDIARLAGPRFVSSIEVERGGRLAEAMVKELTGGDTISARFLYREFFEYKPQFKLFLVANHRPRVSDDDSAIWRRILVVPFEHAIPGDKQDPRVKAELRDPAISGPAVLAWAMEGCLAWQSSGRLVAPEQVVKATRDYRTDMDPLRDFLSDRCDFGEAARVPKTELWNAYQAWAETGGIKFPLKRSEFTARIAELPEVGEAKIHGGTWIWKGIALVGADEAAGWSR